MPAVIASLRFGADSQPPSRQASRARRQQETRQRITEAAVELHGTLGPARTTITQIAERAGVERVTVYRHFPDEAALLRACSQHFAAHNPLPDPTGWRGIADPGRRLRAALAELYAYYRRTEPMLTNVLRDAETMPALWAVGERRRRYLADLRELLARGWPIRGRRRRSLLAALGLALDFTTWRRLAHQEGLADPDAIELMVGLVGHSATAQPRRPVRAAPADPPAAAAPRQR